MRRPLELYPEDGELHQEQDRARRRAIRGIRAIAVPVEGTIDNVNAIGIDQRTRESRARFLEGVRERTADRNLLYSLASAISSPVTPPLATAGDMDVASSVETSLRAPGARTTTRDRPEAARRAAQGLQRAANDRLPNIQPPIALAVPGQNGVDRDGVPSPPTADSLTSVYMNDETLPPLRQILGATTSDYTNVESLFGDPTRRSPYVDIPLIRWLEGRSTDAVRSSAAVTRPIPSIFDGFDTLSESSIGDTTDEEVFHTSPAAAEPAAETVRDDSYFDNWYAAQDDATRELVSYGDYQHYIREATAPSRSQHPLAQEFTFPARSMRHIRQNSTLRITVWRDRTTVNATLDLDPTQCRTMRGFVNAVEAAMLEQGIGRAVDTDRGAEVQSLWGYRVIVRIHGEMAGMLMADNGGTAAAWSRYWRVGFELGRQVVMTGAVISADVDDRRVDRLAQRSMA